MSEMTLCNWHTLQRMKRKAEKRGAEVIVERATEGPLKGWVSARYSDEDKPAAHFMELSEGCAC